MKFSLLILICVSLSMSDPLVPEESDLIFTASLRNEDSGYENLALFRVATVYQGKVDEFIALPLPREIEIKSSVEYLMTINHDLNTNIVTITEAIPVTEATPQIQKLFYKIHCIDPNKISKSGACHRNLDPVCGCDGKTYGNLCEAGKAGVNIYTYGRCK